MTLQSNPPVVEGFTERLQLPWQQVGIIPGNHDINCKACEAYFNHCDANEETPEDRWQAATDLALCLWRKTETTVTIDAHTETATRTLTNLPALQSQPDQAAHQIGSGTLLVRDGEGGFGFIHQSVLEWLVANQAA